MIYILNISSPNKNRLYNNALFHVLHRFWKVLSWVELDQLIHGETPFPVPPDHIGNILVESEPNDQFSTSGSPLMLLQGAATHLLWVHAAFHRP